jgi:hypothetical protein
VDVNIIQKAPENSAKHDFAMNQTRIVSQPAQAINSPITPVHTGVPLPTPGPSPGYTISIQVPNPPVPIFLRLPTGSKRILYPGSNLNYWKLRNLISPGPWNNHQPPIRAYELKKPGTSGGIVLIEHLSLLTWWAPFLKESNSTSPLLPMLGIVLPPILNVVKSGGQCPYTGLKHTMLYELSLRNSPYGPTGIQSWMTSRPGSKVHTIAIDTASLVSFIRSLPPPQYKITPCKFATGKNNSAAPQSPSSDTTVPISADDGAAESQ